MSNPLRLFMKVVTILCLGACLSICFAYEEYPSYSDDNSYNASNTSFDNYTASPSSHENLPANTDNQTAAPIKLADKNYVLLQAELARYQIAAQKVWIPIPDSPRFRYHKRNPYLIALREHLQLSGDLSLDYAPEKNVYDSTMVTAIKRFQARHNLEADGIIGKATLKELNITPQERIHSLEVNLQRWNDLSKKLGERFIVVNIPDYALYLFDHGNQLLMMKTIVGKPDWQTPELHSKITRIVFNPYWHVPIKIAANDLVPKVRTDPYYLDDMHIKVYIKNRNGKESVLSHNDIDWESVSSDDDKYEFRQEPGDDNALGIVKFEFPNKYDVYLHDTPAKSLFEQPTRALSHGCIRLENPLDLVSYLMRDNTKWDPQRIQDVIESRKTTYVELEKPIPIYITYITVWTDENGVVNYRDDIYNRDNPLPDGTNDPEKLNNYHPTI